MKKVFIITAICATFNLVTQAQDKGKFQLDVEVPIKFSAGYGTRLETNYNGILTLTYPQFDTYRNPVFGINLNVLYGLSNHFKIGIGSGLNGVFFEGSPAFRNEYINMLMVPLYGKLRWQKNIKEKFALISDLNAGYQFYDNRIGNDSLGYFFRDKGGLMGGIDIGGGYRTSKYLFSVKLGYEMNIYSHAYRLDWSFPKPITSEDVFKFKTYYNLLKVTFGINIL
jgi:hypothetical protein